MENRNLAQYSRIDLTLGNTDLQILFPPNFYFYPTDWNSPKHIHLFYECHFLKSGEVQIETTSEKVLLQAGSFSIIPSKLPHEIKTIAEATRKISFYVTIAQNKKSENDTFTRFNNLFSADTLYVTDKLKNYLEMLFELVPYTSEPDFMIKSKLTHIFALVFLDLFQEAENVTVFGESNANVRYEEELILKIEEFMINNFSLNAQLDDLAQYLCLSHRQTDRLLRRLFNKSFQKIKNETRIEKAKSLIENQEHSLKEVAETLGYSSYIGFYKAFRLATGLSPEEYRDSLH